MSSTVRIDVQRDRRLVIDAIVVGLMLVMPALASAEPVVIAMQGALRSAAGGPVTDGNYAVGIALYDGPKGGLPLFVEKFLSVPVKSGVFAVELGVLDPTKKLDDALFAAAADKSARWVGVAVGADPELPRVRLRAQPYAVRARFAALAKGLQCTGCVQAMQVGFAYAGSKTKGGPANSALTAQHATQADHAKAADTAKNAAHAKLADVAKSASVATTADQAKTAGAAAKLLCTGCITAAMAAPDLTQGLVATKQLHKVALSGKMADLEGGGDLKGYGKLAKENTWQATQHLKADTDFGSKQALLFRFQSAAAAPAKCSPATVGLAWFDTANGLLRICNGKAWSALGLTPACGDGAVNNKGEQCDDGNFDDGDGCTAKCTLESAPSCKALLAASPNTKSGVYVLDADGKGPLAPFSAYCDMKDDGGGWTRVVNVRPGSIHHGDKPGAIGDVSNAAAAAKLSDAVINLLTTEGRWRWRCGNSVNAYVTNVAKTWTSMKTNNQDWSLDRQRDGKFECKANRKGYVFSDHPACNAGHTNYAASGGLAEGGGCYSTSGGWNQAGTLWAK